MSEVLSPRISHPVAATNSVDIPQRWAVVGGGMLGMTCALRLAEAGHQVTLYEASNQLGGLADAWTLGDICWDRHYHVTLLSDRHLRNLLQDLGLEPDLQWRQTRTGFFTDGRLYSLSNSWEFLTFPPLDLLSKLRLGLTIFGASRIQNWRKLEQVLVADWLRKWSGTKVCEKIWFPLLRSKLGENYKTTSAAFIWATIARLYAARRSGLKKEMFGYLPGGYARTVQRFSDKLDALGVRLHINSPISSILHQVDRLAVTPGRGTSERTRSDQFDSVVVTTPSALIPTLCPQLTEPEKRAHAAIRYQGIVCASILLDRPLSPYYVTNITDPGLPFTGIIEMSALVDPVEFGGQALVYLPHYVACDDPELDEADESIQARFLAGLERMYPDFCRQRVRAFRISRVRQVMALSTLGYSTTLPSVTTSIPGLYALNSAQIVNGTLNVNETVGLAERTINSLLTTEAKSEVRIQDLSHATA